MGTYTFVTKEQFEEGIRTNKYLEFAERGGHLYGIDAEAVRDIIRLESSICHMFFPTILQIKMTNCIVFQAREDVYN